MAETQLRDYEARLGRPFQHEAYMRELAGLRDELRAGLSGTVEEGKEPVDTGAVAERIKALRAGNAVEGSVERVKSERRVSAEVPVTRRIRRERVEEPEVEMVQVETVAERPEPILVEAAVKPEASEPVPLVAGEPIVVPEAEPAFREMVKRGPVTQGRWF